MRISETYDLIILGGESAGLTAAGLAVQFDARAALVEKGRIGPVSIPFRCVVYHRGTLRLFDGRKVVDSNEMVWAPRILSHTPPLRSTVAQDMGHSVPLNRTH